jgi:hypothetical protein
MSGFPEHKSTYEVTIKIEGKEFVARDSSGTWRTRAPIDGYDARTHGHVAYWMFHGFEVESVRNDSSGVSATIREW